MIQNNAQLNFTADANITKQDPTEWLKQYITTTNLMYPIDCNNLFHKESSYYLGDYPLDPLTPDEIMKAWSIFTNETVFNQFLNATQQEYKNNVPAMWYKYFDDNYSYNNTVSDNATISNYKHIADLMIYFGAQTEMDNDSYAVVDGTNYGLDAFNQNYNMDWWYAKKYPGETRTYCTAAV